MDTGKERPGSRRELFEKMDYVEKQTEKLEEECKRLRLTVILLGISNLLQEISSLLFRK